MEDPGNRFNRYSDFPQSASELLKQIEKRARVLSTANSRYMRDIQSNIDEHIFCIINPKGTFAKRLSSCQELQLLDVLVEFFAEIGSQPAEKSAPNVVQHYTYFDVLFCGYEGQRERNLHDARMDVLVNAVSLAVQLRCTPLLNDVGQWIQRSIAQKPATSTMLKIADGLVDDFCQDEEYFSSTLRSNLADVVRESPNLACALLPLCVERYDFGVFAPLSYVEIVCEFMSSNTRLFFRPLKGDSSKNYSLSQWGKYITLCFAKLCCLSVLASASGYLRAKDQDERTTVYSKLQLCLLQTLKNSDNIKLFTTKNVNFCLQKIDEYRSGKCSPISSSSITVNKLDVEESVDRLTQIVQVALSTKCFQGSRKELDPNIASRFVDYEILIFVLSNQLSLS